MMQRRNHQHLTSKPMGRRQELPAKGEEPFKKIIGTCVDMCPTKERNLREREGLLHKFETLEDLQPQRPESSWPVEQSPNIGHTGQDSFNMQNKGGLNPRNRGGRKPLPKADVNKTIKSFARSAAGQDKTLPEDLRPPSVLKATVKYLCYKILPRTDCSFNVIYDFIFDRLRAVRQDLVIQRIENEDAIQILETIVKFHVLSDFRLRDEPISIYDPHINQKHLMDCLRKLLFLYEFNKYNKVSRAEFEALNCLVSLGSYDVLSRAVSIKKIINSRQLDTAIDMGLAYQCRNYARFFKNMTKLSDLLQMYCSRHVRVIRSWAFKVMCIAYGVKTCKIPLSSLTSLLLYRNHTEVHRDLSQLSIEVIRDDKEEKFARFQKANCDLIESKMESISSNFTFPSSPAFSKDLCSPAVSKLWCSY